ncbi:MAG: hypothetical protein ABIE22_01725 [archaeon]
MNKKGMMEMPFGMIFSIFLIVVFVVVAFIAISHFLDLKRCTEVSSFYADLEKDVNTVWKSSTSNQEFSRYLPGGIDYVCFIDFENSEYSLVDGINIYDEYGRYAESEGSIFLYPDNKACNMPYFNLKHINISQTTSRLNPYCIEVEEGRVTFKLEKSFYESLVTIK